MEIKKVLVVEDDEQLQKAWQRIMKDFNFPVEILSAHTIAEAEKLFAENPDVECMVFDACVPGDYINTPPIIREFRNTFTGPMIAISGNEDNRKFLIEAGCDRECEKKFVPANILQALGLRR